METDVTQTPRAGRAEPAAAPEAAAGALRVHLLVFGAAVAVLIGVGVLAAALDVASSTITREPQYTLDGALYVGALSNLGAVVWTVGIVFALVGWSMTGDRSERRMFLGGAGVGAALLADDFFLVHDWFGTESFALEQVVLFTYPVAVVTLLVVFRRPLGPVAAAGIVATLALLGCSVGLSILFDGVDQLWEDGLKFLGICTWSTTWILRARPWSARGPHATPPTNQPIAG